MVATMLVSWSLDRYGARHSYLLAFALFGLGTLVSALSPTMLVFVGGQAFQGAGEGLLIGLGFAVIRSTLPAEGEADSAARRVILGPAALSAVGIAAAARSGAAAK
ncbi:hypothetical protein ACIA03_07625 [Nocardioides sp. NPDC051685]|uniref:hypothetical protein n=1 Tax=Nocardioides sp. NPDC051685 TaxID=3364334 RepID=UPI0037B9B309